MKTELCNFCLKSGILCSKCQGKLKSGKVSEVDFTIARLLLSLEEKYPSLQEVRFHKAVEDLFVPLTILTINKIWLPDGTTETRVILNRGRRKRIPNVKALKELAEKLRGMTLRVEFAQ